MLSLHTIPICAVAIAAAIAADGTIAAEDASTTTVDGTVVLDGKPLIGRVLFHLKDGQFVGAKLDKEGRFKIDRVPPGEWAVTIEGKGVPAKYTSDEATSLRAQVIEGGNTFDFELASK